MGQAKVTKGTKGGLIFQKIYAIVSLKAIAQKLKEKISMLGKRGAQLKHNNLLVEKSAS